MGHNYPNVIPSLLDISANDKRRALRNMHLKLPFGVANAEVPMVKIDPAVWSEHFDKVGRKIMLALHYQTFGTPLPSNGRIWLATLTNGENLDKEWFQFVRDNTGRFVNPTRSRKSLLDQFTLQWDAMDDPKVGMYLVTLHKRIVFVGLTTEQPDRHALPDTGVLFSPFTH